MTDNLGDAAINTAERRIALVIGNAKYARARPLINTAADASAVASAFSRLGYKSHLQSSADGAQRVTAYYDQTLIDMKRLLADFSVASRDAAMSVIYYSGHGIEIDFRNFLIPVDASLEQLHASTTRQYLSEKTSGPRTAPPDCGWSSWTRAGTTPSSVR